MAAIGLWNGMLQPVCKKMTTFKIDEKITCPTEDKPYIFTNKNSN